MTEGPTERKLKELIGVAVGEASMCWNPRPGVQVFDSSKASEIVDRLTCDVLRILADLMDPHTSKSSDELSPQEKAERAYQNQQEMLAANRRVKEALSKPVHNHPQSYSTQCVACTQNEDAGWRKYADCDCDACKPARAQDECAHEWGTDGMHSNVFCKKCFKSQQECKDSEGK